MTGAFRGYKRLHEYENEGLAVNDWPKPVLTARFKASKVEEMVGVSSAMQRLWASKGYDFRGAPANGAVHRLWDWSGVQQIAAFSEVMNLSADFNIAAGIAEKVSELAFTDFRNPPEGGDLLFLWDENLGALPCSANTIGDLLSQWCFVSSIIINFSQLQRRLAEKAELLSAV